MLLEREKNMNKKGKMYFAFGGFFIAFAIIAGLYSLSSPSSATSDSLKAVSETKDEVFTLEELAQYLSINTEELEDIIEKDDIRKAGMGEEPSYDAHQFIPYAMVSGEYRFLKKEILGWLEYLTYNDPSNKMND